ncbi:MAG: hypothetical protein JWM47_473 [Acidimicrobiales bacterium]|nr:hypothetical protein [Acidimicrobiales bacterium]
MWRKAMVYLGLGDDAEYEDYNAGHDDEPERSGHRDRQPQQPQRQPQPPSSVSTVTAVSAGDEPSAIGAVRPVSRSQDLRESAPVTGQTVTPSSMNRPRPQVVRPMAVPANAKPHIVVPASFNQAQEVADKFKNGQPTVMNLQASDRELSRRLIDFASGLCYGLGGQMERLDNQVYLLTPANVEVSAEERRRLHERGYDA